jgi:hypothetical protein
MTDSVGLKLDKEGRFIGETSNLTIVKKDDDPKISNVTSKKLKHYDDKTIGIQKKTSPKYSV